jgi:hypothetical protein
MNHEQARAEESSAMERVLVATQRVQAAFKSLQAQFPRSSRYRPSMQRCRSLKTRKRRSTNCSAICLTGTVEWHTGPAPCVAGVGSQVHLGARRFARLSRADRRGMGDTGGLDR